MTFYGYLVCRLSCYFDDLHGGRQLGRYSKTPYITLQWQGFIAHFPKNIRKNKADS